MSYFHTRGVYYTGDMASRKSSDKVRGALIDAAITQLAREGMRGLTHRKVEDRAGVSQGTAKYHFGTLDGLIEAVLRHMVDVEITAVMQIPPEAVQEATETGVLPTIFWDQARSAMKEIASHPDLLLARYELVLHCARHPQLQPILREARNNFVRATASQLGGAHPEAGARLVIAMVDGLSLHQLSAFEPLVEKMAPAMLLASSAAAVAIPDEPNTPTEEDAPESL